MRSYWVLFVLIIALVVLAGIGTTDLMWGSQPHVVRELKPVEAYILEGQTDEGEHSPGLPVQADEGIVVSIRNQAGKELCNEFVW